MYNIGRLGILQYLTGYFFYGSHQFFYGCRLIGSALRDILCTDCQLITARRYLLGGILNTVHGLADLIYHFIQLIQNISELSDICFRTTAVNIKITIGKLLYDSLQIRYNLFQNSCGGLKAVGKSAQLILRFIRYSDLKIAGRDLLRRSYQVRNRIYQHFGKHFRHGCIKYDS